jgi:hypothetical protein
VTAFDLVATGTGDDALGIAQVELFVEDPASLNGVVDGMDSTLGTWTYPADDGTIAYTGAPIDIVAGQATSLLVVYDFSLAAAGAAPPVTYAWELTNVLAGYSISLPAGNPTGSAEVDGCGLSLCGDCNGDGVVSILDALLAAQSGASILVLTGVQFSNCNVQGILEPDPAAVVDVLDALGIAQLAAALPVTLACCL